MSERVRLGLWLCNARVAAGYSLREVAEALGISVVKLGEVERGVSFTESAPEVSRQPEDDNSSEIPNSSAALRLAHGLLADAGYSLRGDEDYDGLLEVLKADVCQCPPDERNPVTDERGRKIDDNCGYPIRAPEDDDIVTTSEKEQEAVRSVADEDQTYAAYEDLEEPPQSVAEAEKTSLAPLLKALIHDSQERQIEQAVRLLQFCMACGSDLDTGFECTYCGRDWMPAVDAIRRTVTEARQPEEDSGDVRPDVAFAARHRASAPDGETT